MIKPKVSVVILVYNSELYIERCARSLFNQTLSEIEYIFINDCTQDSSIDIINSVLLEFPQRQNQVRIINLSENVGQAAARKIGITESTGEYIIHCDSDDWVEHNAYQLLYNNACMNNADLVFHDYFISDGSNHKEIKTNLNLLSQEEILKSTLNGTVKGSLWLVLVKTDLYKHSKFVFPTGNMTEDSTMIIQLIDIAQIINYIPKALYYYYLNPNSISHSISKNKCLNRFYDCVTNTKLLEDYLRKNHLQNYEEDLLLKKLDSINQLIPCIHHNTYYNLWKSAFPNLYKKVYKNNKMGIIKKIKFYMTYHRLYPIWHWLCGYSFAE